MSWQATLWAANLPHSRVDGVPFRVLMLLADHAHDDGSAAYRAVSGLAHTLEVSERTVKRALADLRAKGLIFEGDQRIVNHLPAGKRPVVYNLALPLARVAQEPLEVGVTDLSPVTTVVPDIRKNPPSISTKTSRGNHTAPVTPDRSVCPVRHRSHLRDEETGVCAACGQDRSGRSIA